MRYGFVLPDGDARTAADLAHAAEAAGWDGFFVWEPIYGVDAWVALTAAAMRTERIRLGTMLTPPSRMRPWKLAGEAATLDNLSGGRVTISVGLGAIDIGFAAFGEQTDRIIRAELLDESLEIMTGLWRGQPFSYDGKHYTVRPLDFPVQAAPPVQQPRIPIWVVGVWGSAKSLARSLRYDGILPQVIETDADGKRIARQANIDEVRALRAHIDSARAGDPFDLIVEGTTPGDDPAAAAAMVRPWAEAGATWWIESLWDAQGGGEGRDRVRRRLEQGPPRID